MRTTHDIATMTIDQVRDRLAEVCALQARLDAEKIALNARMVSLLNDPVCPAFVVPERELMAHGGLTSREAREVVARGLVSEAAPAIADALADGATTAAHVDALGRGLRIAGDRRDAFLAHLPELVEASTTLNAADFGQLVKETAKSVIDDDGMSTLRRQQRETFFSIESRGIGDWARRSSSRSNLVPRTLTRGDGEPTGPRRCRATTTCAQSLSRGESPIDGRSGRAWHPAHNG